MAESGLVAAYRLDGAGGARQLDWAGVNAWQPGQGALWVHLNRESADTSQWLDEHSGLPSLVVQALLAEETRPRCVPMDGGLMLFLRGVNLNPGADPEDMVSIRLWVEGERVISVRLRHLMSVSELRRALEAGQGPHDVGEFVTELSGRLVARMAGVIAEVDDEVDRIQAQMLEMESQQARNELSELRRSIIALRRYLAPQRDAMGRLAQIRQDWLGEAQAMRLREETDRVTRYVEELDAARERAAVTQEELNNRLSEQMNVRMYVLSMIAGIFLPLGFVTGLLGINVGGIPLAENPWGFVIVILMLVGITGLEVWLFRWKRWL